MWSNDTPPNSLINSIVNSKVKIAEGSKVGVRSLACNISKVEGHAKASGWGLGRIISGPIIHTDLQNPNNKLVSAQLKHFWWTHKTHHSPNLRKSTTFPLILVSMPGHRVNTKMSFCLGTPKLRPNFLKLGFLQLWRPITSHVNL
jgi:hypothetical protein